MVRKKFPKPVKAPSVRTAAIYALNITLVLYLLFTVVLIYGRSAVLPMDDGHHHAPPVPPFQIRFMLFGFISTFIYLFAVFCLNFRILKIKYGTWTKSVLAVLATLLSAMVWSRLMHLLQSSLFDLPPMDPRAMRGGMFRDVVLGGITLLTSQISYLSYNRQQVALENESLRAEYERARYETLKSQIDPHFLFNTLNTLNSLIASEPGKAQEYVQKLSSVFRYTMQNNETTTLAEELAFTRDYCALMQIRYGESLRFDFDISGKYNSYLVVPLSIQTLVENAIKHNVISNRHVLNITVSTDADDTITVSNPLNRKKDVEPGGGIGLENLSERYRLKWGRDIVIRANEDVFSVTLPLVADNSITNI